MVNARDSVLLPKLFADAQYQLGQLLPLPLEPSTSPYSSPILNALEPGAILPPNIEKPYNVLTSLDSNGNFFIDMTNLLGIRMGGKSTSLLSIQAEEATHEVLKNADELFLQICAEPGTQAWINSIMHFGYFYMVVGIQRLKKARFQRVEMRQGHGGGHFAIPTEMTGQIPVSFSAGVSHEGLGVSNTLTDGIFGIDVRKVKCNTMKPDEPKMAPKVEYHFSHQRYKGTAQEGESYDDDNEVYSVVLGDFAKQEEFET